MIVWQWRAWPDPFIDFGRELYVPWQLSEGKVLYTDIAYFNGPLSAYFNAVIFHLFGPSLMVIIITNLILTAAVIFLLYRLIQRIANRLTATATGIIFVTVFAFGNLMICSNFNFICPYSHEMTHGILLTLIAITFLDMFLRYHKTWYLVGMGLSIGLCFLTKAECTLAIVAAVIITSCISCFCECPPLPRVIRTCLIFIFAAAVPVLVTFFLLARHMPYPHAFKAIIGAWAWTGDERITTMPYYQWVMGLDHPAERIKTLFLWAGIYALIVAPAAILACLIPTIKPYRYAIAGSVLILLALILIPLVPKFAAYHPFFIRPVPLILSITLAALLFVTLKKRSSLKDPSQTMLSIALLAFAVILLVKIFLFCRPLHYGFALAMPATIMTVVLLLYWIPDWITKRGGSAVVFRAVIAVFLAVFVLCEIQAMQYRLNKKNTIAGSGPDRFRTDAKGIYLNDLLDYIDHNLRPEDTLTVLPEGIMVNYLARRINPTPYINFMPPELVMFGQDNMIRTFEEHNPDCIVLVHKNTTTYGYTYFGKDYGQDLYQWVLQNYAPVHQIGPAPFKDDRFGILVLKVK